MKIEKPFIHLLSSPWGYYFYDVNRNEIVATDGSRFYLLEKALKCEDLAEYNEIMTHLKGIMDQGYLSNKRPKVIEHPKTKLMKYYLDNNMEQMTLQLTQNCNFRCAYCNYSQPDTGVQRHHANKRMTAETARKAIDFFAEHSRGTETLVIGFYGGEPLLEFDLLKEAVAYAEYLFEGRNLRFTLTTNGSVFNDNIIKFCLQHNLDIMVSLDGPREIHDKNRVFAESGKGTFDTVIRNINYIKENWPEFFKRIHFNMVVDPGNDYECYNQIPMDYDAVTHDSMHISFVDTLMLEDGRYSVSEKFAERQEYHNFLAFMNKRNRIKKEDLSPISLSYMDSVEFFKKQLIRSATTFDTMAPSGPCLPGVLRTMVDVDGTLFPCERCSETAPIMNIGSIDKGFDVEKAQIILNVGKIDQDKCKNCFAIRSCTVCCSVIADHDHMSSAKKAAKCMETRNYIEDMLLNIVALNELAF